MADINFPDNPSQGTTYTFEGVRYTYNATDGGYWEITQPGSYGAASSAEVDAGTDTVKYITPEALAGSDLGQGAGKILYQGEVVLEGNSLGVTVTPTTSTAPSVVEVASDSMSVLLTASGSGSSNPDLVGLLTTDTNGSNPDSILEHDRASGSTVLYGGFTGAYLGDSQLALVSGNDVDQQIIASSDVVSVAMEAGGSTTGAEARLTAYTSGGTGAKNLLNFEYNLDRLNMYSDELNLNAALLGLKASSAVTTTIGGTDELTVSAGTVAVANLITAADTLFAKASVAGLINAGTVSAGTITSSNNVIASGMVQGNLVTVQAAGSNTAKLRADSNSGRLELVAYGTAEGTKANKVEMLHQDGSGSGSRIVVSSDRVANTTEIYAGGNLVGTFSSTGLGVVGALSAQGISTTTLSTSGVATLNSASVTGVMSANSANITNAITSGSSNTGALTVSGNSDLNTVDVTSLTATGNVLADAGIFDSVDTDALTVNNNAELGSLDVLGASSLAAVTATTLSATGNVSGSTANITGLATLGSVSSGAINSTGTSSFGTINLTTLTATGTVSGSVGALTTVNSTTINNSGKVTTGTLEATSTSTLAGINAANLTVTNYLTSFGTLQGATVTVQATGTADSEFFMDSNSSNIAFKCYGTGGSNDNRFDILHRDGNSSNSKLVMRSDRSANTTALYSGGSLRGTFNSSGLVVVGTVSSTTGSFNALSVSGTSTLGTVNAGAVSGTTLNFSGLASLVNVDCGDIDAEDIDANNITCTTTTGTGIIASGYMTCNGTMTADTLRAVGVSTTSDSDLRLDSDTNSILLRSYGSAGSNDNRFDLIHRDGSAANGKTVLRSDRSANTTTIYSGGSSRGLFNSAGLTVTGKLTSTNADIAGTINTAALSATGTVSGYYGSFSDVYGADSVSGGTIYTTPQSSSAVNIECRSQDGRILLQAGSNGSGEVSLKQTNSSGGNEIYLLKSNLNSGNTDIYGGGQLVATFSSSFIDFHVPTSADGGGGSADTLVGDVCVAEHASSGAKIEFNNTSLFSSIAMSGRSGPSGTNVETGTVFSVVQNGHDSTNTLRLDSPSAGSTKYANLGNAGFGFNTTVISGGPPNQGDVVIQQPSTGANYSILSLVAANTTASTRMINCWTSNFSNNMYVLNSGTINNATGVYGTTSDIRTKTGITPAKSQWEDVKSIEVVNYNLREEYRSDDNPTLLGVVADQLLEAGHDGLVDVPEDEDEMKSVKTSVMMMKGFKALQEAMNRIEELEAKVASLLEQ